MTVYVHVCMYIPRICPIDAYCVKQTQLSPSIQTFVCQILSFVTKVTCKGTILCFPYHAGMKDALHPSAWSISHNEITFYMLKLAYWSGS